MWFGGGVKVRIGVSLGAGRDSAEFADAVDLLEQAGVDSLWLSEVVSADVVDPLVGMAWALARTRKLKVGTGVAVLPGRHPAAVAKQLATLAALAPGRVLPVFGLQPARPAERDLFPVPPGRRGALFDESLTLLRQLLEQDQVTFTGEFFQVADVTVRPRPGKPLDLWVGGRAPGGLRRAGRLADGWLASFLTPAEAQAGREAIQRAAAEADREVEADHFGVNLVVAPGDAADAVATARALRPELDPHDLVAGSWSDLQRLVERHVAAGISKFVLRPAGDTPFAEFLAGFTRHALPLQN